MQKSEKKLSKTLRPPEMSKGQRMEAAEKYVQGTMKDFLLRLTQTKTTLVTVRAETEQAALNYASKTFAPKDKETLLGVVVVEGKEV